MDREEMLAKEEESWLAFYDVTEAMPIDRRDEEGVVPGWSTHDVVWHCAFWAGEAAAVLERRNAGDESVALEVPDFPEDEILAQGRAMSWHEVMSKALQARGRVRLALHACPEITDPVVEMFASETYDHYDEHAQEVRAFIS